MWTYLVAAADVPPTTGDQAVKVAVVTGVVTIAVALIGAVVTLLRRDGDRTTASPPATSEESPTMLALVKALGARLDDLVDRVADLARQVERYESRRNHPSGGGPS